VTIDAHAHWRPPGLIEMMRARTSEPRIIRNSDGSDVVRKQGREEPIETSFDDVDVRLRDMASLGISAGLISMLLEFAWIEHLPVDESLPLVRQYNDSVSGLCEQNPGRFAAYATLPLTDIAAAAEEFDRAMQLPGIVGAQLPGNGFLTLRDADDFRPIMEVANRHGGVAFIHNNPRPGDPWPKYARDVDNMRRRNGTLQSQANLSAAMMTLSLTDFLDDYPDARVHIHNLGGNIPLEVERMDHRSLEDDPDLDPPSVHFARSKVFVDCNSFGPRGIEAGVRTYGEDRIMFGTDGSAFGARWSFRAIEEAQISESARQKILHSNAERMLSHLVPLRSD
jgi:predicted TIM-barrel fold metal-dependent hydrolase